MRCERRWRTIYTVWKGGDSPLARPVKPAAARPTASPEEPLPTTGARTKAARRGSNAANAKVAGERVAGVVAEQVAKVSPDLIAKLRARGCAILLTVLLNSNTHSLL